MSAAKRRPHVYSHTHENADRQESLRQVKMQCEQLKEKLQRSVIDNPQTAKKAALLIGLWIEGKQRKRSR
jgi:hypothetical protein